MIKTFKDKLANQLTKLINNNEIRSYENEGIKESPIWLTSSLWILMTTAGFGVTWLGFAKTEEIVVTTGKLQPVESVQEMHVPLNGVVSNINVKEGERVKKGQLLLQLDTEASSKRKETLEKNLNYKQTQLELKQKEMRNYLKLNSTERKIIAKNLRLQKEILDRLVYLREQGASPEFQLLQQEDRIQQLEGELKKQEDARAQNSAAFEQQIEDIRVDIEDLTSQLTSAEVTIRYQEVKSPSDGFVFDLKPTSPGYVTQQGVPVVKIVPFGKLQAKVEIPSRSIGFVHNGQDVDISIDSYPASDFGVLSGTVSQVSSDALPPDPTKGMREYHFPATINLERQQLKLKNGKFLPLQAGMSLSANIKLRKVSYLQLLLGGFKDKTDSLRQI